MTDVGRERWTRSQDVPRDSAHPGRRVPLPAASSSPRWFPWAAVLLFAATALVYLPVVFAGFVWDDQGQIVQNAGNLRLSRIPSYFVADVWSTTSQQDIARPPYYRPLFMTSLAVDHALFGRSAWGYHLQSLLWHLAAVAAFLAWLRQVLPPGPALLSAAIFALHPLQSESVCWISGRGDPMAAAFVFLALLALTPPGVGASRGVLGFLAMSAALFSKEPAIMAPALLLGSDCARAGRPGPWRRYAWLGAAIAVWAMFHFHATAGVGLPPGRLDALWPKLFDILGLYGRLLFWPHPLTTGRHLLYLDAPTWASAAGILGVLGLSGWLLVRGGRVAAAGLAWGLLTFLPSLYAMAGSYQLGERYLYLSLAGVALAVGWVARAQSPRRIGLAITPWVAAALWVIQDRLPDWKDGLALTASEVEVAPSPYTWGGHGLELAGAGRWAEALPWLERALDGVVPDQNVCETSVRAALMVGEVQRAVALARLTRVRHCHPTYRLILWHALAYARAGRWNDLAKAVRFLERSPEDDRWKPVAGVLAIVQGDVPRFQALLAREGASGPVFRRQVAALLEASGHSELVSRVLGASTVSGSGTGSGDTP